MKIMRWIRSRYSKRCPSRSKPIFSAFATISESIAFGTYPQTTNWARVIVSIFVANVTFGAFMVHFWSQIYAHGSITSICKFPVHFRPKVAPPGGQGSESLFHGDHTRVGCLCGRSFKFQDSGCGFPIFRSRGLRSALRFWCRCSWSLR